MNIQDLVIMEIPCDTGVREVTVNGALGYGPHWTFTGKIKSVINNGRAADVYQVVALTDFYSVRPGDIGGWIDSEETLSQTDRCWLAKNCVAIEGTVISGTTYLTGNLIVSESKLTDVMCECGTDDNVLSVIEKSNLNSVMLNGVFTVHESKIAHSKFNEYILGKEYRRIDIYGGKYNRVTLDCFNLILDNCVLNDLDISAELLNDKKGRMEIHKMSLSGMSMQTRRPELLLGREFDRQFDGIDVRSYISLGTYSCNSLSYVIDSDNSSGYVPEYSEDDDLLDYFTYKSKIHEIDASSWSLQDDILLSNYYVDSLSSYIRSSFSKPTPSMADLNIDEINEAEVEDLGE